MDRIITHNRSTLCLHSSATGRTSSHSTHRLTNPTAVTATATLQQHIPKCVTSDLPSTDADIPDGGSLPAGSPSHRLSSLLMNDTSRASRRLKCGKMHDTAYPAGQERRNLCPMCQRASGGILRITAIGSQR